MNKAETFSFKRHILYPACIVFCLLVFLYFLMALSAGVNVLESETVRTEIYDDAEGSTSLESSNQSPSALPVQTLLGLFLFAMSVTALNFVFKLDMSPIYKNLLHFGGTLLSFFIFVLSLSGFISDSGFTMALGSCLFVAVIYFFVRGIMLLIRKLTKGFKNTSFAKSVSRYIPAVFGVFTLIVFAVSFFALITQLDVIIRVKEDPTFIYDDVRQNIFVTVVTPIAPTLQNYLRYLASAAVFILAYSMLFIKANKVLKMILNFGVLTAGYLFIWIIGFDYFRLVSQNALPAIIVYLSVYLVIFIAVCVYKYYQKRTSEQTETYETQFK